MDAHAYRVAVGVAATILRRRARHRSRGIYRGTGALVYSSVYTMPGLVTCQGSSLETQWNVGSDDFVMPSFLNVVLTLLWLAHYAVRIVYLAKCVVIA